MATKQIRVDQANKSASKQTKASPDGKPSAAKKKTSRGSSGTDSGRPLHQALRHFCKQPEPKIREFDQSISPTRAFSILAHGMKWSNGTNLTFYCFKDGDAVPTSWHGQAADIAQVRSAFAQWKALGIGLDFTEVSRPQDAMVRIGFEPVSGSWSHVGRAVLDIREPLSRTMNFGWPLTTADGRDTALHEIGHTLGLEHEHQNPNSGIVWNVPNVMTYFRGPPNNWNDSTIEHNILRAISTDRVRGSSWDPDSVMEYSFGKGLIDQPAKYRTGLTPAGGLSTLDKAWIVEAYPALSAVLPKLEIGLSQKMALGIGQTRVFEFTPDRTRTFELGTFGVSDTVMVVFDASSGENIQIAGDDDSGQDRNARISLKLVKDRPYQIGVRLYFADSIEETSLMVW